MTSEEDKLSQTEEVSTRKNENGEIFTSHKSTDTNSTDTLTLKDKMLEQCEEESAMPSDCNIDPPVVKCPDTSKLNGVVHSPLRDEKGSESNSSPLDSPVDSPKVSLGSSSSRPLVNTSKSTDLSSASKTVSTEQNISPTTKDINKETNDSDTNFTLSLKNLTNVSEPKNQTTETPIPEKKSTEVSDFKSTEPEQCQTNSEEKSVEKSVEKSLVECTRNSSETSLETPSGNTCSKSSVNINSENSGENLLSSVSDRSSEALEAKSTKICSSEIAKKSSESCLSKSDEKIEISQDSQDEFPPPGSPLSDVSSHLSLEETLLKDDFNDINDCPENDSFCEEKLLKGETDLDVEEGMGSKCEETNTKDRELTELNITEDKNDQETKNNSKNTSQQDQEIEKILKNLDDSLKNSKSVQDNTSSDKINNAITNTQQNSKIGNTTENSRGDISSENSRNAESAGSKSADALIIGRKANKSENSRGAVSSENSRGSFSCENSRGAVSAENSRGAASSENSRGAISAENSRGAISSENSRGAVSAENSRGAASSDNSRGAASSDNSRGDISSENSRNVELSENSKIGELSEESSKSGSRFGKRNAVISGKSTSSKENSRCDEDSALNSKSSSNESSQGQGKGSENVKKNILNSNLPENLDSNKSVEKRSLPSDFKDKQDGSNSNSSPFKMLKVTQTAKETPNTDSPTKSSSKTSALTFSEALKSIAVEDRFDPLDAPIKPLVPTTEIDSSELTTSSSFTVLEPLNTLPVSKENSSSSTSLSDSTNSSKKRRLTDGDEVVAVKPDLKKVRVFKNGSQLDHSEKNVEESLPKSSETDSNTTDTDSNTTKRLKEVINAVATGFDKENKDKPSENKSDGNQVERDSVMLDEDELELRTTQEIRNSSLGNKKLKKIKRKDLESLVIELFVDKVLYEHQLGQQKDLCKRLEATLEANRKKAAQFHKEVEDLKKVTQRLQAEHLARKTQVVAPVKVKRSVGIQANPSIIGKGLMHTFTHGNIRVLSASSSNNVGNQVSSRENNNSVNKNILSKTKPATSDDTPKILSTLLSPNLNTSTTSNSTKSVQALSIVGESFKVNHVQTSRVITTQHINIASQTNSSTTAKMVMVNPLMVQQQNGSSNVSSPIVPVGTRLVRTPLTPLATSAIPSSLQTSTPKSNSGVIDLTDDEDSARAPRVSPGGVLALQRSPGVSISQASAGQFVTLNTPSSVGPLVLVPSNMRPSTAAIVMGSVPNNASQAIPTGMSPVRSAIIPSSTPGTRFSSPTIVNTRVVVGAQLNGGTIVAAKPLHPAPLPKAPPQQTSGYSKKLPPIPILKLSHKDNSIVLSWNMAKTEEHERIASYQLYAYQEGTTPPSPALWKKVGSVKALELPMACTLTQFMPGHVYHFAVRAVDIRSRMGPFSEPRSIRLGK